MPAKEIKYDMAAREKIMKGVDTLANAVKVTLGPRGHNVVIGNVITQGTATQNPALLSMGAEAGGRPGGPLVLRDNRFVNQHPGTPEAPARFVHLWRDRLAGPVEVVDEGNAYDGPGLRGVPE